MHVERDRERDKCFIDNTCFAANAASVADECDVGMERWTNDTDTLIQKFSEEKL